jgi:hypothetical protein
MSNSLLLNSSNFTFDSNDEHFQRILSREFSVKMPASKLALLLFLLIVTFTAYAQKPVVRTKVQLLKQESDFQKSSVLNKLVYGARPTLYVDQTRTKMTDGEHPLVVDIDASSLENLSKNDVRYASAKLLIINLKTESDKLIKLNESQLKSFQKLEYILFSSQINMSEKDIQTIFIGKTNSRITTHYRVLPIAQ